ncbi:hypothetical protein ACFWVM_29250 [Nocardia fluminea]|uniref:hypothetical protein n=1 Tax=Nocardia fluminea TaxID=134984 RepID=UPI0036567F84
MSDSFKTDFELLYDIDRSIKLHEALGLDVLPLHAIRDGVEAVAEVDHVIGEALDTVQTSGRYAVVGGRVRMALSRAGLEIVDVDDTVETFVIGKSGGIKISVPKSATCELAEDIRDMAHRPGTNAQILVERVRPLRAITARDDNEPPF